MKKQFTDCQFFVKPIGIESNQRLVELLGQDAGVNEQQDQPCIGGRSESEYLVPNEKLIVVLKSTLVPSGLNYEYFVRINGKLHPVQFSTHQRFDSVEQVVSIADEMTKKSLKLLLHNKKPVSKGTFPMNVMKVKPIRIIKPTRKRKI